MRSHRGFIEDLSFWVLGCRVLDLILRDCGSDGRQALGAPGIHGEYEEVLGSASRIVYRYTGNADIRAWGCTCGTLEGSPKTL